MYSRFWVIVFVLFSFLSTSGLSASTVIAESVPQTPGANESRIFLPAISRSPQRLPLEIINHLGGEPSGLVLAQDRLFAAYGGRVTVLDASDPAALSVIGEAVLPNAIDEIAVAGPVIYASTTTNFFAGGTGTLYFIDLNANGLPAPRRGQDSSYIQILFPAEIQQLLVYKEMLYVAADGIYAVDITQPSSPLLLGKVIEWTDHRTEYRRMYIAQNNLIAVTESRIDRFSLKLPTAPQKTASTYIASTNLVAANETTLAACEGSGDWNCLEIALYNLQSPEEIRLIHRFSKSGNYAAFLGMADNHLIIGSGQYSFNLIIDISVPDNPKQLDGFIELDTPNPKNHLVAIQRSASAQFVLSSTGVIHAIALPQPERKRPAAASESLPKLGRYQPIWSEWADVFDLHNPDPDSGPILYIAGQESLDVIDFTASTPAMTDQVALPPRRAEYKNLPRHSAKMIRVENGRLFVVADAVSPDAGRYVLKRYSLADPQHPVEDGELLLGDFEKPQFLGGCTGIIFNRTISSGTTLSRIDLCAAQFERQNQWQWDEAPRYIQAANVQGEVVYIVGADENGLASLLVVDLSGGNGPVVQNRSDLPAGSVYSYAVVDGNHLFLAGSSGIRAYDISSSLQPIFRGEDASAPVTAIHSADGRQTVVRQNLLRLLNYSDAGGFVLRAESDIDPEFARQVERAGRSVYMGGGSGGLYLVVDTQNN